MKYHAYEPCRLPLSLSAPQVRKVVAFRNIDSNSMKKLLETIGEGAQAVQMDLDDKSSVESAFEGADAVFGTFNYWGTIASVGWDEAKAVEIEYNQGKNVVDAAKQAGVKHVVCQL